LKAGIRLMFWSGASFDEDGLKPGTGKFKDASITYTSSDQITGSKSRAKSSGITKISSNAKASCSG